MFNIMNMLQITKWDLYLINFKQVNRFAVRGFIINCLTFHSECLLVQAMF